MPTLSDQDNLQSIQESVNLLQASLSALKGHFQEVMTGLKGFTEEANAAAKSLKSVATASEKLDTDKLTNFAKSIILSAASLQKLDTDKLTNFAKSIRSVSAASEKLNTDNLSKFPETITSVATAVGSALSKLNAEKFDSFAKSIRSTTTALGRLDADKAGEFDSFAKSVRSISTASEKLNTDNLANFPKTIRSLATASGKLDADKAEKLSSFSKSIRSAAAALSKLTKDSVDELSSFVQALTLVGPALGGLTKASVEKLSSFSKSLRSTATALAKLTKSHVSNLSGFAKALSSVSSAVDGLNADKFANVVKSIRSTATVLAKLTKSNVNKLSDFAKALPSISSAVDGLNADKFASFAKSIRSIAAALAKLTKSNVDKLSGFADKLRQVTVSIEEAVSKISKNKFASFAQGLGTIATSLKKLKPSSVDNLSGFAKSLGQVAVAMETAVGKISKNKFASFAKGLGTIATAAKRLDPNSINNLSTFTKKLEKETSKISVSLSKLDVNAFASFSRSIKYVSDSLAKLDPGHINRLGNLSTALKSFTNKINPAELKQAGDAMRSMFTGLRGGGGDGGTGRSGLGVVQRGLGELTAAISPLTLALVTLTRIFRNFVNLFQVFSEFEFTMARVGGVTRTVGHEFQRLTDFAREMGATTIFTATDAAQAMETLGRLGFTAGEILSALPGVLNVAAGEGIKLADAARIVAVNLNAFELQASDTGRITNVLAAASISSAASMKDLGIGLRTVGTFAHTAGLQIEETVTMLSKLADAGLTPYRASVALRQLLLQMQVPARAGALEQLDKMGLRVADINPKVVGLTQAITTLKQRLTEFNIDANRVFTIRASQAFQVLSQVGGRSLGNFEQSITGTNTAARLATRQMDTLHGSFRKLVSVWQEMQIGVGTALVPLMRSLTDTLAGFIRVFANMSDGQQKFVANTTSMTVGLILLFQTVKFGRKILNAAGRAFVGFATSVIASSGAMNTQTMAALTSWQAIGGMMKTLGARAAAFGAAAVTALGPWGLVAAGVVAAITAAIGGLMYWRRRAEREREQEAERERDRLRNEINLRGLILQRLDEQARYRHERSFTPDEQEQVKELAKQMDILNVEFDESGHIVGETAEKINELSAAMRKAEAHSKILTKIEAFRSRSGKVVFDLEERVALKAFAEQIGEVGVEFNKLGEAIFETAEHQKRFMDLMSEMRRQGEITLAGEDVADFQGQRATLMAELAKSVVGPFQLSPSARTGTNAGDLLAIREQEAYRARVASMEQELSAMLSATELAESGTGKIEDLIASRPTEQRSDLLRMTNMLIGLTKEISDAEAKIDELEARKGVFNPFAAPPPIEDRTKGFLETMDDIAKRSEKQQLEIEAKQLDAPLQSHQMMLDAYQEEIKALEQLRKHRDAASYPDEMWDLELEIIRKRIAYNNLVAQQEEKTQQERVRQFEVTLQTMSRGARDWSIQRIEANRYMLRKMMDQAKEFEEVRPGTFNKWRKAIDDLTKAQTERQQQNARDVAAMYKKELDEATKSIAVGDYQGILDQMKVLMSVQLEIQGTDAFDYASDLREELEDQVVAAFANANKKLEGMLKEGLLGQIAIESARIQDVDHIGVLQDRMERVRDIQRSVFEDDLYKQFPDLQVDIGDAVAAALRTMMDRMAVLAKEQMLQSVESGMDLTGILAKYEDVIGLLGDSLDMTDVIKAAADKAKERQAQSEQAFKNATERLDDELASLTLQELEQKKIIFNQFAKMAQAFGMSVDEFVRTYSEIIKNIDDEIKRRADQAKNDAVSQRLRDQDLTIPPAAAGITPTGQEGQPGQPQDGDTGVRQPATTQRTTIGQEMRAAGYRAPIFGFRARAGLQTEALRDQLDALKNQEQEYRDRLAQQGDRRGAISRDPRILGFRRQQRAIEDQIKAIERQSEAYGRFREATENVTDIMFDSFSKLSTFIKTEGGKILLSGFNIFNQFDLGQYIEKLGASYSTLASFFNTFGTSVQQASSIVDFTGKIYEKNANRFTKHLAGVASALSGVPGALQQGLGAGGALSSVAGGLGGFFLGGPQGAALGASIGSSLYAAISNRSDLEDEVDGSTNVSGARGSVNVRRQTINIANINNEVTVNTETLDDTQLDVVAEQLGERFENNIAIADGEL